ncbi:hypothetical protein FOXYSP1_07753 [Fusarium oxysporum f. sp. phaseoli]
MGRTLTNCENVFLVPEQVINTWLCNHATSQSKNLLLRHDDKIQCNAG